MLKRMFDPDKGNKDVRSFANIISFFVIRFFSVPSRVLAREIPYDQLNIELHPTVFFILFYFFLWKRITPGKSMEITNASF